MFFMVISSKSNQYTVGNESKYYKPQFHLPNCVFYYPCIIMLIRMDNGICTR